MTFLHKFLCTGFEISYNGMLSCPVNNHISYTLFRVSRFLSMLFFNLIYHHCSYNSGWLCAHIHFGWQLKWNLQWNYHWFYTFRPTHKVLLESLREFFFANQNHPKFSLTFLSEMIHEEPEKASLVDADVAALLEEIDAHDLAGFEGRTSSPTEFANTVLILFSDHGPRMGKARLSPQVRPLIDDFPIWLIFDEVAPLWHNCSAWLWKL